MGRGGTGLSCPSLLPATTHGPGQRHGSQTPAARCGPGVAQHGCGSRPERILERRAVLRRISTSCRNSRFNRFHLLWSVYWFTFCRDRTPLSAALVSRTVLLTAQLKL